MCYNMFPLIVVYFLLIAYSSVHATQVKRSWDTGASSYCVLPPCPKHANYEVTGVMETWHGENWPTEVEFTCWPGYTLVGSRAIECYDGSWSDQTPECIEASHFITAQNYYQQQVQQQQQQYVSQSQQYVSQSQQHVPESQQYVPQSQQYVPQSQQFVPDQPHIMQQPYQCVPQPKHCVPEPQQCVPQTQTNRFTSQQLKSPLEQPRITSASTGGCTLPPYPDEGNYFMKIEMNVASSNQPLTTNLTYTCYGNYILEGSPSIICLNGRWSDNFPYCRERRPTDKKALVFAYAGGLRAVRGELPWHVGIYDKTVELYMQICGGTLISNNRAISAAHCFWDDVERQLPAANYAVAVGKLYPSWDDQRDMNSQKSDVNEIRIPPRYQHGAADFQEDIALLTLTKNFEYGDFVKPASLDFNFELDSKHLRDGNLGKVGGWGLITEGGKPSADLQVVAIPNIGIERCIAENEPGFRNYITSDKICAGYRNGTSACRGDSGGGLVFSEDDNGTQRHYLRGIISTAPDNGNACNVYVWTTFTHVQRHEYFIKPWLAA